MEQKWYQSWVFWSSTIMTIVGLLSALGIWQLMGVSNDEALRIAGAIVAAVSQILSAMNNPYNQTGYGPNTPPTEQPTEPEQPAQ